MSPSFFHHMTQEKHFISLGIDLDIINSRKFTTDNVLEHCTPILCFVLINTRCIDDKLSCYMHFITNKHSNYRN